MKIKIFKTEIYISFLFAAVIVIMLSTDRTGLALPTITAVTIHELGHLIAMWVAGCSPSSVRLIPASVQIIRPFSVSICSEVSILLCGPAANIAVFLALFLNNAIFENDTALIFAFTNLIIALFNLLPVSGLDGGRLLYVFIARFSNEIKAKKTVRIVSVFLFIGVFFGAVYISIIGKPNISLFIAAIYFLISCIIKI